MNQEQENKSRMWDGLEDYLTKKNSVRAGNVGFSKHVAKFRGFKTLFDTTAQKQTKPTTGITKDKNTAKAEAITAATLMTGNVRAYASEKGNATLADKMNYSANKLKRMGEPILKEVLVNIHTDAAAITDGADYNINTNTCKDLKTKVDNFIAFLPKPKTAKGERKTATNDLDTIVVGGDAELTLMDGMIGYFLLVDAEFVATYKNLRNIDNYGGGKKPKPEEPK